MAKLVWDASGEHIYETGTKNGVLYPPKGKDDAIGNKSSYGPGVAWNGLTGATESPSGADSTDLWADDIKYLSMRAAEEFGGTITAYQSPKEFDECDGTVTVNGVSFGQQKRAAFGFAFKSTIGNDEKQQDFGYKIHLWYGCTCSPSERSYSTINDSPEAIEMSWEVETTPIAIDGAPDLKPTSCITLDSVAIAKAGKTSVLESLEEMLFGGEGSEAIAYLPTPGAIYAMFGGAMA